MNRFMLPPRRNPMLQCRKYLRLGNLRVFTQARPLSDRQDATRRGRASLSEADVQRSAYWTDETRRANWMPLRQLELQRAKLLDCAHDFIAGLQPHLLIFGISENDALGC